MRDKELTASQPKKRHRWPWVVTCWLCALLSGTSVLAQSESARRLTWQTFETDHFVVHYPVSSGNPGDPRAIDGAKLASRAGTLSEMLYGKLGQAFDISALPLPIHLIVEAHQVSGSEAFAQPEWVKIHIPAQPGPEFLAGGQGDWLEDVLAHELGHLVLAYSGGAVAPGLAGLVEVGIGDRTFRRSIGEDGVTGPGVEAGARVPLADGAPFFWVEGGAEFLAFLAGTNEWRAGRDMLLRTAALEGLLLSPSELQSSLGKTGMDGDRAYNQGYALLLFLHERYGEASFERIVAASRRKFRWQWTDAIDEGQGIAFNELYGRWMEWLQQQYQPAMELRNQEVVGEELSMTIPPWRSPDLEVRRRWMAKPARERRADREGKGLVSAYPAWTSDGQYLATWENGLNVRAVPELLWPPFGGRPLEAVRDRLELARRERRQAAMPGVLQYPVSWNPDGKRLVVVANENWQPESGHMGSSPWSALFLIDVIEGNNKTLSLALVPPGTAIPNTLGAQEPAWSRDGRWIAFVRYNSGSANLWIVRPDGTEAQALTQFADGTSLGHPSWSPDSQRIVFQMFRHGQRDLWTVDLTRRELLPIMLDEADDRHPCWGYDGKIYFSSDMTGIFNLFSYDPSTLEVRRLTDVVGGAFMPYVSERDNVTYVYFDGYSYRLYGLRASDRLDESVDNSAYFVDPTLARGVLQGAMEAPSANGRAYRAFRGFSRVMVIPGLRATERDLEGGLRLRWKDPLERQELYLEGSAGLSSTAHARYSFTRPRAQLRFGAWRDSSKESTILNVSETEDGALTEVRRERRLAAGYGTTGFSLSPRLHLDFTVDARDLAFREADKGLTPTDLYRSVGGGPTLLYSSFPAQGLHSAESIDPRGGFRFVLRYNYRVARTWDPLTGGLLYQEGEWLGSYDFHRVDCELNGAWGLPWAGHTLEWRLNGGTINRNVAYWDELKAGSRLSGFDLLLDPFVPFPGYEDLSLSGETLAIGALAYRIPVLPHISKTFGPLYLDSFYLQVGGTLGNVWGYRARDEGSEREDPFTDASLRNTIGSVGRRMLREVGLELRLSASLFARYRWGSFLRLGYAMDDVTGLGDVDRNGIYPGLYGDLVPEAGGEIYPAGLRVSLGLGTGF